MENQYDNGGFPNRLSRSTATLAALDRGFKQVSSAELISIPKQLRAEWLDVIGHDPDVSFSATKVAIVVGAHFNRYSGDTFISQETIAAILDRDLRTARRGLEELEERGYIVVQRRDLGRRTHDGRMICGGRGVANVYFPALDRGRISAMNVGGRLRDRMEALLRRAIERKEKNRKEGMGALLRATKEGKNGRKRGTGVLPTLSNPTDCSNPAAVSAGAADETPADAAEEARTLALSPTIELEPSPAALAPSSEPPTMASSPPTELEPAPSAIAASAAPARQGAPIELPHEFAAVLKQRLGVTYQSWFGDARMVGFDDLASTLVLSAPNAFVSNWLRTRLDFYIIDAWNQSRRLHGAPHAERLEVKVIAK